MKFRGKSGIINLGVGHELIYIDLRGWQKKRKYDTIREVGGNWKMSNPIGQVTETVHQALGRRITGIKGLSSY